MSDALSGEAELAANEVKYPFPKWAMNGNRARAWIFADVVRGGVGAEVGVFRGHFSEVILSTLTPRKFYMIDPWTTWGEFFPWAVEYTNNGTLPTAVALREAQLRAARFPDTDTVCIEAGFPDCIAQIEEPLDWIYIDSSHEYTATLRELKAAASILKPGGVILGDDFYANRANFHHGVFRAVNEFVKTSSYEFVAAGPRGQFHLRRSDIGSIGPKGQKSIAEKLAASQIRFPYPERATIEIRALQEILKFAPAGSVGAEVGAFRGHFSEVVLTKRMPRKFFMIDAWTKTGDFFASDNDYTNEGTLPTKVARDEAGWRAAKYSSTETVLVDDEFSQWAADAPAESMDWIYLHSGRNCRQTLVQLVMAARLLRVGGVIMGGGYYPDGSRFQHDVFRAVNEFIGVAPFEFVATGSAGQWCLRRSAAGW